MTYLVYLSDLPDLDHDLSVGYMWFMSLCNRSICSIYLIWIMICLICLSDISDVDHDLSDLSDLSELYNDSLIYLSDLFDLVYLLNLPDQHHYLSDLSVQSL